MLKQSKRNPKLSAYNQILGNFNFNAKPPVSPGYKVVIYEFFKGRKTRASHGVLGYYIVLLEYHYINYE